MLVGCERRAALRAGSPGTPQSPVATKKVSRLWEQDAAGSNPVSPMPISPQLITETSVKDWGFLLPWDRHRIPTHRVTGIIALIEKDVAAALKVRTEDVKAFIADHAYEAE